MPTLDWVGKKAVVGHHRQVPYWLLHCNGKLSAGDPDAGNRRMVEIKRIPRDLLAKCDFQEEA